VWLELRRRGVRVGRKRVERIMRVNGRKGAYLRRGWKGGSTKQNPRHTAAPDLLGRDFTAVAPNSKWVADLTRILTGEGGVGDSFDNALAENLWSTIKIELTYWPATTFATRAEAQAALFRYIDGWYNPRRIQQGLDGRSPNEYEAAWQARQRQPQPATLQPEGAGSR
jgi:transposase InsO family protein